MTLSPHEVFAQVSASNKSLSRLASKTLEKDCIPKLTESVVGVDEVFTSVPKRNHLGTPYLRVRLCRRIECTSRDQVVLIGIFNRKRTDLMYDNRVLVLDAEAPYTQISISQPIVFAGVASHEFVFTHGLCWREPKFERGRLIGYLDDRVLISIGIADKAGGLLEVTVEDLLQSQMPCPSLQ